jgi:CheY-like chemotaxis protein
MVIRKMMQKLGYEVTIAENGLKAVEAVHTGKYDLVFMDMNMPEMNGVEASIEIRKSYNGKIEIHALTANAFEEDRKTCLDAGMDGFLTKPLKLDEITKVIIEISKKKQIKNAV